MKSKTAMPGWMLKFHEEHGVWPIAGGSGEPPPDPNAGGVTVQEGTPPAQAPPSGQGTETPPATPVPTHTVDPNAFNRGTQEAPGTQTTPQVGDPNPTTGRTFTEAEVEKIRQEEKDKLYGKLSSVEEELKSLRDEREREKAEREAHEEEAQRKAEEAGEKDLDVRDLLTKKEQEWTDRFNRVQNQLEERDALLEKERQFNALQEYKRNQLETHEDDIMPQLRDTIDGNNEEEIQASIQRAIEKTNDIMQSVTQAQAQQLQQTPTTRVTQPGGGGPLEQVEGQTRTFSPQDIKNMSMQEYAQYREQLQRAAAQRGPYGG